MKKFVVLLLSLMVVLSSCLVFTGCLPPSFNDAKTAEQEHYEYVISLLKKNLKDPDSLKVSTVLCRKVESVDTTSSLYSSLDSSIRNKLKVGDYCYNINYNAKNSFGAYVGEKTVYYIYFSGYNSASECPSWLMLIVDGQCLDINY